MDDLFNFGSHKAVKELVDVAKGEKDLDEWKQENGDNQDDDNTFSW